MICPPEDSNTFQTCVKCEACKPDNSQRVADFLEIINLQASEYATIAGAVMA